MFLSMNNSNYMSNRNHFKDTGTFLSKKQFMPSTKMYLMTPRIVKSSAHNFMEFFGPNQRSLSFKMAEIWPFL